MENRPTKVSEPEPGTVLIKGSGPLPSRPRGLTGLDKLDPNTRKCLLDSYGYLRDICNAIYEGTAFIDEGQLISGLAKLHQACDQLAFSEKACMDLERVIVDLEG